MNLNKLLTIVFITALKVSLCAQESPVVKDTVLLQNLGEVVVTATRTYRQLSSVPLPVTLIGKEQLKKTGAIRLDDILNEQTGLITVADESGFNGIQMQGISSDYIMVLIDGVPLIGRSSGNLDLGRLATGNIEQIEIVKGPSSSLYGSKALGGVINIITEVPKDSVLHGDISHRMARFGTHDSNIGIKQRLKRTGYSFFANTLFSNGYDLHPQVLGQTVSPFNDHTLNGRIYFDITDKLKVFMSGRYYKQEQESDLFANDQLFEGDSDISEKNLHMRLDQKKNEKLDLEYELYYTGYKATEFLQSPLTGTVFNESEFDQQLLRPEIRGTYILRPKHTITIGAGYNHENLERTFFDEKVSFDSQYAYAQYDFHPVEKLNLILGARFDNHSEYRSQFSPKASLNYRFNDHISFKGSLGYGFKAPDFRQLYFDFTNSVVGYTVLGYNVAVDKLQQLDEQGQLINTIFDLADLQDPLKPESSIGINIGTRYKKGKLEVHLNYFRNDFKNLIDTRAIARRTNGQNVFSYINFDKVYTTGLEVDANYRITNTLSLAGGYQLLYAKDKDKKVALERGEVFARDPVSLQTVALDNQDYFGLVNRSRHTANLKLFYEVPKWGFNTNLRLNYRSKYALFDDNGNGIIDDFDSTFVNGFALANITFNKTFASRYTLQVGANNLFDYKDEENIPGLAGILLFTKIIFQF